jgi:hypothetical protein
MFLLIVAAFYPSCRVKDTDLELPGSVVADFYDAINAGDFIKAESFFIQGHSIQTEGLEQLAGGIGNIELVSIKMESIAGVKMATVITKVTLNDEAYDLAGTEGGVWIYQLEKQEDTWKIVSRHQ